MQQSPAERPCLVNLLRGRQCWLAGRRDLATASCPGKTKLSGAAQQATASINHANVTLHGTPVRSPPTAVLVNPRSTTLSPVGRIGGPPAAPHHTLLSITGPQQATQALQAPAAAGKMARLALGSLVLVLLLAAARAEERSFRATVVSPEAGQWGGSKVASPPSGL